MFLKQNIPKFKKVFQSVPILLTALVCTLSLNTIQTHAEEDYSGWAKSIVDSMGSSNTGGNSSIQHGVWHTKTGYLCYLLDKNGNAVPGTNALAFKSPGYFEHDGARWYCTSRKGNYTVNTWSGTADWNCTPWQEAQNGYAATNEPQIRDYFDTMDNSNNQNGTKFVFKNWGETAASEYTKGNYYLVVETMMHFQYSVKSGSSAQSQLDEAIDRINNLSDTALMTEAKQQGLTGTYSTWYSYIKALAKNPGNTKAKENAAAVAANTRKRLITEVRRAYEDANLSENGGRSFVGDPVIGTVPNLIEYKGKIGTTTTVFNSYTNKVAPFAEMIRPGDVGETVLKFQAWRGGTSSQISDSDVFKYGVAMMVISATNPLQTTADEPQIPTPHPAPVESTGTFSIIKNYRTKDTTTNTLTDDGCFTTSNLSNQITIENERDYQVVGWATSSSTSTIDSITWPVPSPITQGTTPTTITLEGTEKSLYLLLEKTEDPPPEEPQDYNYKLTQSSITRRVNFTTPDHRLSMPHIENHNFKWIIPAHQNSCPGHTFTDACHGQHIGPHTEDCPEACSSTCTKAHTHNTEGCQDPHYYDCGTRCTTQTAYCSGWQWHEQNLKLSINNTHQSNHPDILATKSGWNTEPQNSKLTKHYYLNDASFTRTSTASQSYEESNWDYICILMRGKDKLTIAHWQNAGQGNGLPNQANSNLQAVSSSGFAVSNQDSGTRKTQDYMETFSTYFSTEESEGVDNRTYYKSTIDATVDAPDTPKGSTLCGINERKAYISNPLSINNIKVRIK